MADKGIGIDKPSIESQTEADAASDAEMDTALDTIMGTDDSAPAQDSATTPKDGQVQDAKDTTKSVDSDPGEPKAAPTDGANTDEYRQAVRSLQRDKVPQKVLDSLTPEEAIAWGTERGKNHLELDRIISRKAELDRAKKIIKDDPDPKAKDTTLDDAVAQFETEFGEEMSTPLKAFGEALLKKASEGNEAQRVQLETLSKQMQFRERNEAREALSKRWNLSDERWQQVLDYADADANSHESVSKSIEAGCCQLFANEIVDDLGSKLGVEHATRSKGQPTTETRTTPASTKSVADLEDSMLDDIMDGKSADVEKKSREIGRRVQGVGVPAAGMVGIK